MVRNVEIKNRIVLPPMATNLASEKGAVTEQLVAHYVRRAKGPGLVVVEHSYVSKEGQLSKNQLGIYDDSLVNGLGGLVEAVHRLGTPSARRSE